MVTTTNAVLMQLLSNQMRYMAQRQAVLSQNISNLDTPGYEASDLKKLDFSKLTSDSANRLQMRATAPNHLASLDANSGYEVNKVRDTFETTPVGNHVTLEDEMSKISDTGIQYNLSSSLLKKYIGMYHTALGH